MKQRMNKMSKVKKLFLCIAVVMLTAASLVSIYFGDCYMAKQEAWDVIQEAPGKSDGGVKVVRENGRYFFDGPGDERAFVFLQGAKVEEEAYAPLMKELAEKGIDCFLVSCPANFALFHRSAAVRPAEDHEYAEWYIGGHSLGGAAASMTAAEYDFMFSGIVLLGSYPAKQLPGDMRLLSIYGSEDRVLDKDSYREGKKFWPEDANEIVIEGGNHAGFGDYGKQKGDGKAKIENKEQIEKTVEELASWVEKRK